MRLKSGCNFVLIETLWNVNFIDEAEHLKEVNPY